MSEIELIRLGLLSGVIAGAGIFALMVGLMLEYEHWNPDQCHDSNADPEIEERN